MNESELSFRMEWALYQDKNRRSIDAYWQRQAELAEPQPLWYHKRLLKEQVIQILKYLELGLSEYQIRDMTGVPLRKIKNLYYRHWKPENRNNENAGQFRRVTSPSAAIRVRPDFSRRPPTHNL